MPFPLPLRLTRFFLSSPPPSFLIFIPAISPSSSPKGAALRNFCGSSLFPAADFPIPRLVSFPLFSSLSLSLSFVQFFLLSFSRLTRASRGGEGLVERNVALSAIVDYCSAPSRRLLEENYVFLQLSKQTEVEEKCGRREEGGF